MAPTALGILGLYLSLAFGLRSLIQWRRTGSTGFRGISGTVGSAEWTGGVLFVVALVAATAAPALELAAVLPPWAPLTAPSIRWVGLGLAVLGLTGTLWAQFAMGDAWRIGVDPAERTTLVARGPFRLVRNPIFTSMLAGLGGLALLTPNVVALGGFLALLGALELQVRRVEEPYLIATHGAAYRRYAHRTGRFLPGLGRIA